MPEEPTTADLVEWARHAFDALNRGDVHPALDHYSPDAVFDTAGYGMGTFEGREAIRGLLKEWSSSFDDLTVEVDEIPRLRERGRPFRLPPRGSSHRRHQPCSSAFRDHQ